MPMTGTNRRACVCEQQRAADDERGDAAEGHRTVPIPPHAGQSRMCLEN
jgi:hypothetical protein